jgi:hypothetical protein
METVMRASWKCLLAVLIVAACPWTAAQAGWGVGVVIGGPVYPAPYYPYGYYYRPYPYYYAPPPTVVVAPAPVVQTVPATPPVAYAPPAPAEPAPGTLPVGVTRGDEVDQNLSQLSSSDPQARAAAAVQLGRLRARRAIDPLIRVLGQDPVPTVREAAARGLGLIGAPGGLAALQRAAQADDNPEVRHSAQFAAEGIRASLRGQ